MDDHGDAQEEETATGQTSESDTLPPESRIYPQPDRLGRLSRWISPPRSSARRHQRREQLHQGRRVLLPSLSETPKNQRLAMISRL